MAISIRDLEEAAAGGWRAPEEARLKGVWRGQGRWVGGGGWLLRAAGGFTGRANSALATGDPGMPLAGAAAEVCRWYTARGLPAMVSVARSLREPSPGGLILRFYAILLGNKCPQNTTFLPGWSFPLVT